MQRLGLCCLFHEAPIRFRTTTARYISTLKDKGEDYLTHLNQIIQSNLKNLLLAVRFCADNGIGSFRINSRLLPIYTHPEHGYHLDDMPSVVEILNAFNAIKEEAKNHNIRLTFHPDQFVVLNSPRANVVESSIVDLEYHALLAKLLGADVINIHVGGGYGDKKEAMSRFSKTFDRLSSEVKRALTIENDDRVYTPNDLIPLCKSLQIPLVYDVHHHRCLPDKLSVAEATEKSLKTWNREPLFHISSPKEGWGGTKTRPHHDFIDLQDVPKEWIKIDPLTIEIEAKSKEVAVMRLLTQLKDENWNLN